MYNIIIIILALVITSTLIDIEKSIEKYVDFYTKEKNTFVNPYGHDTTIITMPPNFK